MDVFVRKRAKRKRKTCEKRTRENVFQIHIMAFGILCDSSFKRYISITIISNDCIDSVTFFPDNVAFIIKIHFAISFVSFVKFYHVRLLNTYNLFKYRIIFKLIPLNCDLIVLFVIKAANKSDSLTWQTKRSPCSVYVRKALIQFKTRYEFASLFPMLNTILGQRKMPRDFTT